MIGSELYRDMEDVETPAKRAFKPIRRGTHTVPEKHKRDAVRLRMRGVSTRTLADVYGVTPSAVRRWIQDYSHKVTT